MPLRAPDDNRLRFGPFEFEARSGRLRKYGTLLPAQRQPLEFLRALLEKPGEVVTREELKQRLWPTGLHVEFERNLNRCVNKLRTLLSDRASKPRYIETVAGVGYRWITKVELVERNEVEAPAAARLEAPLHEAQGVFHAESPLLREGPAHDLPTQETHADARLEFRKVPAWTQLIVTMFAVLLVVAVGFGWGFNHNARAQLRTTPPRDQAAKLAGAGWLFVLNEKGHSVSIVNPLTNMVDATVPMAADPRGVAISRDGSLAYISLNGVDRVVAVNTRTHRIEATVAAGNNPVGVAANPRPPYVYVANNYSNSISVIDSSSNTLVRELHVGSVPTEIAVSPDGTRAVVTNQSSGTVTVIDCVKNTVLATIAVGATPVGVAFTLDSRAAWVALAGQGEVAIVDLARQQVTHRIAGGPSPIRVAMGLGGRRALISNFYSNTVTVIDTATLKAIGTITVGLNPVGITFGPAGDLAYVANFGSNNVSVIDASTLTLVRTIPVGVGPVEMAVVACFMDACDQEPSKRAGL